MTQHTTPMALAARNVGLANESLFVAEGSFGECVVALAKWMSGQTMAKRFDVCFARTKEDAERTVAQPRDRRNESHARVAEENQELILQLLADAGVGVNTKAGDEA